MDRYNHGREIDLFEVSVEQAAELSPVAVEARFAESEPWLASLHGVLAAAAKPLSEKAAASSLGVSSRTMQRYLRSLGTTFRQERKAVRSGVKQGD
jgi:AraC-like DNA-binding protein